MDSFRYAPSQIINMDESAIYIDSPPGYSYGSKGSKRVKAATAGAERVRISTAWTATASGYKFPIYTIIPRVNVIPELHELSNLIIKYKTSSTFDADTILEWLNQVILPYKEQLESERLLIILDRATCHVSTKVINID